MFSHRVPPKVHLNQIVSEYMDVMVRVIYHEKCSYVYHLSISFILHIVKEENSLKLIKPFFKNIMLRI